MADERADGISNWGKWGADDEIGALNYITPEKIMAASRLIKKGKVFTLGMPLTQDWNEPLWPGRSPSIRFNVGDASHYMAGRPLLPGGRKGASDWMGLYIHGTTHSDSLGHTWHGDKVWNGYDEKVTIGGMAKAGIFKPAEQGIVGRGVLLDIARFRGVENLQAGEPVPFTEFMACAKKQGLHFESGDIVLCRTGWIPAMVKNPELKKVSEYNEPGIQYSLEFLQWFKDAEIAVIAADTIACEQTVNTAPEEIGSTIPFHKYLMRNLGVFIHEIYWLEDLAEDCAKDGVYEFFYVASPLKLKLGTGSPINPIAIK
jgi:kynurenine formamidase